MNKAIVENDVLKKVRDEAIKDAKLGVTLGKAYIVTTTSTGGIVVSSSTSLVHSSPARTYSNSVRRSTVKRK